MVRLLTCTVDLDTGALSAGREGLLTPRERGLLTYLAERPGQVVSREELLRVAFGYVATTRTRAVDKAMSSLRRKVDDAQPPLELLTRRGEGYVFVPIHGSTAPEPSPEQPVEPTPIPHPRGAFVGRVAELSTLTQMLSTHRLVTVYGLVGAGKTRLVLEHVHQTRDAWPGGICFCDLSGLSNADGVLQAIGDALGVRAQPNPVDEIGRELHRRGRCLLLLDNVEQVLAPTRTWLDVWTKRAFELRCLITSREPLGIGGEQRILVGPMTDQDGVELYLRCASAAGGLLTLSPDDEAVLPDVVRLLDRLPLAIELAASRVRLLPPRRLLPRLTDRFRLLARRPGASARHPSLEQTLDWSWDRLSPSEQVGLAQLSVFEGGFTLEAAEAVLDVEEPAVDVIEGLVDRGFVQIGTDRCTLLVSVQAYASQRLVDPAPVQARRARYAALRHSVKNNLDNLILSQNSTGEESRARQTGDPADYGTARCDEPQSRGEGRG